MAREVGKMAGKKTRMEYCFGYHNDLLAGKLGIDKTRELIARKYYWPTL